jgi:hypothetical protein
MLFAQLPARTKVSPHEIEIEISSPPTIMQSSKGRLPSQRALRPLLLLGIVRVAGTPVSLHVR